MVSDHRPAAVTSPVEVGAPPRRWTRRQFRRWLRAPLRGVRFRRAMRLARAARMLRESADPFAQLRLACELERTPLGVSERGVAGLEVPSHQVIATIRQRLVSVVVYRLLLPAMVLHLGAPKEPIVLPIPRPWRLRAQALGVNVAQARSLIAWAALVVLMFGRGISTGLRLFRLSAREQLPPGTGDYSVLMNVGPSNLPAEPGRPGHDFVNWYRSAKIDPPHIHVWAHIPGGPVTQHPDVTVVPHYLPRLDGAIATLRFALSALGVALAAMGAMLTGRWWRAVLLEQTVELCYVRSVRADRLARSYVFNNSVFVLRPLWTYWAESLGSAVYLVFYATNIEPFPRGESPRAEWPGYRGMTWSRYVVWDEDQAGFLRALGHGDRDIRVVGEVGFSDAPAGQATLPSAPFAAVFDVTPQHPVSLALRGIPQPYYTPETTGTFMTDVADMLDERGMIMVQKRKRRLGQFTAPRYRTFLEAFERRPNVVSMAPELAPQRLIGSAVCTISMPFTSTALIALAMGNPSVYYDPIGALSADFELAHGVPVITSRGALADWLDGVRATQHSTTAHKAALAHRY